MTMPRLSLYRPQKGNDYRFIDKNIWEMFQVGGTDVLIHKYLGPGTSTTSGSFTQPTYNETDPLQIQDLLFLENRDRKYDPDIYILRGVYNIQDTDFNLSQFGLFLQNDTIFITFHINDTVEKIGRKLIAGDVLELPHLKDEFALNDLTFALKRFYVIEEVTRAAEGFSVTWYPHLYRAKCKPLVDSQEFKQILDGIANTDGFVGEWESTVTYYPGDVVTGPDGKKYNVLAEVTGIAPPNLDFYEPAETLREIMSTYEREMQITQAVLNQAESDVPKSGFDNSKFYHLQKDADGNAELVTVDNSIIDEASADRETQATDVNGIYQYEEPIWQSTPLYQLGDVFSYDIDNLDQRAAKIYTVIKTIPTTLVLNPSLPNTEYYQESTDATPIYVGITASSMLAAAEQKGYQGYITADGLPPNGAPFTAGIAFPLEPTEGQYCLRKDYLPYRLFRYNGARWIKMEDVQRMTMSNLGSSDTGTGDTYEGKDVRRTLKTSFINNTSTAVIDGHTVKEKQSLSKALRPQADE